MVAFRVLVTGIPLDVSLETFYDALRSYTAGGRGVHNALIIRSVTDKGSEGDGTSKATETGKAAIQSEERGDVVNTGAALIDFTSKAAADDAIRADFYLNGTLLTCELVGPVVPASGSTSVADAKAAKAAEKRGREGYTLWRRRKQNKRDGKGVGSSMTASNALPLISDDEDETKRDEPAASSPVAQPGADVEVTVRLICRDKDLKHLYAPFSVLSRSGELSLPSGAAVSLFEDVANAIRRATLGHVRSLQRISENEVHVIVDAHTAAQLMERTRVSTGDDGGRQLSWTVAVCPRPRIDHRLLHLHETGASPFSPAFFQLAEGAPQEPSVQLAKKNEVLEAMSAMMAHSGGRYGALRDAYGNICFPKW